MSLSEGWQEATGTSPLLLGLLVLIGVSLLVLFLAPFFFSLVRKIKFPRRLPSIRFKKITIKSKKAFGVSLTLLAIFLLVVGVGGCYYLFGQKETPRNNPQIEKERLGPRGDFQINLTRQGDKVILDWDKKIEISEISLVSLGKDTTDDDNTPVWGISNQVSLKDIDPAKLESALKSPPKEQPAPKLISPPYEILSKPAGFNYDQYVKGDQAKFTMRKGSRYAVELLGIRDKIYINAAYVFEY